MRYHAVFAPIVCFAGSGLLVRTVVVACPPYNRAPGTLACKPVLANLARSDLNESEEREKVVTLVVVVEVVVVVTVVVVFTTER